MHKGYTKKNKVTFHWCSYSICIVLECILESVCKKMVNRASSLNFHYLQEFLSYGDFLVQEYNCKYNFGWCQSVGQWTDLKKHVLSSAAVKWTCTLCTNQYPTHLEHRGNIYISPSFTWLNSQRGFLVFVTTWFSQDMHTCWLPSKEDCVQRGITP